MIRLFVLLVMSFSVHAAEIPDLNGMWVGFFGYGSEGANIVECSMVVEQSGTNIEGRMLEKQTFGSEPSIGLSASLSGTANGDLVSVTKTYDGSGGQTHSVNYVFTLDEEGEILHGIWSLNGMSGRVVFRRVTPQIFSEILN